LAAAKHDRARKRGRQRRRPRREPIRSRVRSLANGGERREGGSRRGCRTANGGAGEVDARSSRSPSSMGCMLSGWKGCLLRYYYCRDAESSQARSLKHGRSRARSACKSADALAPESPTPPTASAGAGFCRGTTSEEQGGGLVQRITGLGSRQPWAAAHGRLQSCLGWSGAAGAECVDQRCTEERRCSGETRGWARYDACLRVEGKRIVRHDAICCRLHDQRRPTSVLAGGRRSLVT
jgi:hypothetical protein